VVIVMLQIYVWVVTVEGDMNVLCDKV